MSAIVDAHHHIWYRKDLPWLQGPSVPRIFGDYDPIKRDYPVEEYLDDLSGTGVAKSVYVQVNWAPERALDEVAWAQSVADRHGFPHGIVGFVDFTQDSAPGLLDRMAGYGNMRGIRQQLHWHDNPQYRFAPRPDVMADTAFRRNFAHLADHGWLFELQVFSDQMKDAADLAAAFPDTVFVLEHAGMLEDLSPAGWQAWREGMRRLAELENMHTKLSGLGTFVHRVDRQLIADIVGETLTIFGPDRCVWGSNFPIEKIWTDYAALIDAHLAALAGLSAADRDKVLNGNAVRLYRLAD